MLDKGSQDRLRKEVNDLRVSSKPFSDAFDLSLNSIAVPQGEKKKLTNSRNVFNFVKDSILHPIDSTKEVVGKKLLKSRNKGLVILEVPNPLLKIVAEPVDIEAMKKDNTEIIKIIRQMGGTLRDTTYGDKLGLAATQVGINKRIFIWLGAVCINPEFIPPKYDATIEVTEGCYSIPGKLYKTKRHRVGYARWYSYEGERRERKIKGNDAIVYQHELDHLDGKCVSDIGVEIIQ